MAGDVERGLPPGPWVLALGMHRSGTSAAAGVLGALGLSLPVPGDLVSGRYDNPVHNESATLTDLDDALLRALGGSWSAPPDLPDGWERAPAVTQAMRGAPGALRRAFPVVGPVVWKDPRLCLLLPLWQTVLPPPLHFVFVWRTPMAVARSLRARQGFTLSLGLALWERYTRAALDVLSGRRTYVLRYEELVGEPEGSVASLASWIHDGIGLAPGAEARSAAVSSIAVGGGRGEGDDDLPDVVTEVVATLRTMTGGHDRLPSSATPPPPAWMADAVGQRRDYEELYARYMRYVRVRRRIPFLGRRSS